MKKFKFRVVIKILLLISVNHYAATAAFIPVLPKCEYSINPIGIDVAAPRFSWQIQDERRNAVQTAYQLLVGTDSISLVSGKADAWNSGKINSDKTNNIQYGGIKLVSRKKYYWQVISWDQEGKPSSASAVASFETGFFSITEWKGHWISDTSDIRYKPAPYFAKFFSVTSKIKSARAYICGLGYYELSLNGKKIGDHMLDPAYTRYDKTMFYVTYDITGVLQQQENTIGVLLGNGWYNEQSKAVWYFDRAPWRDRPKFLLNVYIEYEDGRTEIIVTDKSWRTAPSPIIFNNIYSGEYYDAGLEQAGWDKPGFDYSKWKHVLQCLPPAGKLTAQSVPPIRISAEIKPISLKKINDTVYLVDMGQNFAGFSRLTVSGPRGTTLLLKHGEDLSNAGGTRLNQRNISVHYRFEDSSEAAQTDKFILKGTGTEVFTQHFTYHGYRYVEIRSDRPVTLTKESVTGLVAHTDFQRIGSFNCSNDLLNRIYTAGIWSYISNAFGIPTDCPHREKNGWTGDGHISAETGLYNFDGILFYEKWINDFADEQRAAGDIAGIIPTSGWGYSFGNGPVWDAALLFIPNYLYDYYGDDYLVKKYYNRYKRYLDYLQFRADSNIQHIGLGDWSPYKSVTPVELTSSSYYAVMTRIMAKFARIAGNTADMQKFTDLSERIKASINTKMLDTVNAVYANGTQTAYSTMLCQDIVPAGLKEKVINNLVKAVAAGNNHLDVGMIGSKYLLNALTENGRTDIAYTIATQKTRPSWGWWLEQGETTFQESWGLGPSRNHIFLGEIVAWLYKALAGINTDPDNPGYKNIIIHPQFPDSLFFVKASTQTVHGPVSVDWQKDKHNNISLQLVVPANSSATVYLPAIAGKKLYESGKPVQKDNSEIKLMPAAGNTNVCHIGSGAYRFEIK
jgi:alpha-L-rhamnosidase